MLDTATEEGTKLLIFLALPSEGTEFKKIKLLGIDLGKLPCIELHGPFSPYPKLKIISWEGLDAQIL